MEIELIEIRDFMAKHHPFDVLDATLLNELPKKITIRYFKQGSPFPDSLIEKNTLCVVRMGEIELRNEQGQLVDKLAAGDNYLVSRKKDKDLKALCGICTEDLLVYQINYEYIKDLQAQCAEFRNQFNKSINERLRHAVEMAQSEGMRDLSAMKLEVSGLAAHAPVIVDIATSIRDAAIIMTDEHVSSIIVTKNNKLEGLVTDRDVKSRCVAAGIDYNEPVSVIMTKEVKSVKRSSLLSEALLLMTKFNIHHLPIMDEDMPVGMITTSDVIRHLSTSPALIASDIYQANSLQTLMKISSRLPELQLQLSLSSSTAKHIGEVFSSITDAITSRLIELAEKEHGAPPVKYVWMAAGSQARNEQTSHSDQDNALIISDQCTTEHETYFRNLANYVCDGLNACGYVYCPGNAMASNQQWRQPLNQWIENFSSWINTPEPKALMLSSIFFDMRPVHGDFSLFNTLQTKIMEQANNNENFLSQMVGNALTHQPPLGFFKNFVMINDDNHKNTLDIKHRGIVPITDIARIVALENGIKACNTTERLEQAFKCHALSEEMHSNLIDALEYIGSLRIRHQAKNIRSGLDADNYLPIKELSGIEKNHLKDAFSIIKTMQKFIENRYPASRVG